MKTTVSALAVVAAAALLMTAGAATAATADSIIESAKLARCKTVLVCTSGSSYVRRPSVYDRLRPRGVTVTRRCVRRQQCP